MPVMPTDTRNHFAQVASNGARLLDHAIPGWHERISAEDLRLDATCDCILGQLFGDYMEGRVLMDLTSAESANHGFTIPVPFNREPCWAELTEAWRNEINRRMNAPVVRPDGTIPMPLEV